MAPGPRTVVHFSARCIPADPPGPYEFWSTQSEKGEVITGRRPAGADPGERFRMLEGRPGHEALWAAAKAAVVVRPASADEVLNWLNTHPAEAPCAGKCEIGEAKLRVVKAANGSFAFVPLQ